MLNLPIVSMIQPSWLETLSNSCLSARKLGN
jgi:hypothetical protein